MAAFVHADVFEEILIRTDVKDLLRFKSVCKSWYSLITSRRFINLHLNHSCNKDRYNNELGHRRIRLTDDDDDLVGSSNGLICICSSTSRVLVGNPLTREVRQLELMRVNPFWNGIQVIFLAQKGEHQTRVHVLSLKLNAWKDIREVKYRFISKFGILCNGALHWIVEDQNTKKIIIAYDLRKEELKEIPQPNDARYECTSRSQLGIVNDCLCIYRDKNSRDDRWWMEIYNVKQSWERLQHNRKIKYDIVHYFSTRHKRLWYLTTFEQSVLHWDYIEAPIYVKSLVSPHVRPKLEGGNKKSDTVDSICA
ncbi:putative F-box domain-containing protein [Helianthus annuus]|nr:putative F-box domain-containing protein [Helianthus annuus]